MNIASKITDKITLNQYHIGDAYVNKEVTIFDNGAVLLTDYYHKDGEASRMDIIQLNAEELRTILKAVL